jgi:hypothetical protein
MPPCHEADDLSADRDCVDSALLAIFLSSLAVAMAFEKSHVPAGPTRPADAPIENVAPQAGENQ